MIETTLSLTEDEKKVYDLIVNCGGRITQLQIARMCFVGCHEKFEGYDNPKQSTLRQVRRIIRDLRMNKGLFILSDTDGYWLMKNRDEAKVYLERIERVAKSTSKGYFETYQAMKRNFGINSEYFNEQGKLF